jgi:DNA-directed RNA polymerase subunit RPC12/RpoP
MRRCARCGGRVIVEPTADGPEYLCLSCGQREPVTPLVPVEPKAPSVAYVDPRRRHDIRVSQEAL